MTISYEKLTRNPDRKEFSVLKGMTLTRAEVLFDRRLVRFHTSDGRVFILYHEQDCCENVEVEEIIGGLDNLLGDPILLAEESNEEHSGEDVHSTWTFYKLSTFKGSVTIRWLGESNGYYSEGVDFAEVTKNHRPKGFKSVETRLRGFREELVHQISTCKSVQYRYSNERERNKARLDTLESVLSEFDTNFPEVKRV